MKSKSNYVVIVNAWRYSKKYYFKNSTSAYNFYLKNKEKFECSIICKNEIQTHKQLSMFSNENK